MERWGGGGDEGGWEGGANQSTVVYDTGSSPTGLLNSMCCRRSATENDEFYVS